MNRSITLGCAAGLFCHNDFVTRAQMAIFMQRLGAALTPTILYTWASGSSLLDLDQAPVLCQTGDYVAPFPQTIIIHSRVSVDATGGDLDYWTHGAISFNSGGTWSFLSGSASTEARAINGGGMCSRRAPTS